MIFRIVRITRAMALQGALALMVALPLSAQRTHVLLVVGLSGAPQFKRSFEAAAQSARSAATNRWGVSDSSLIVLTEDSTRTALSSGRSTRENIAQALLRLSSRVQPGDVLFVMLMGHGSGEGAQSKVNLPGPDATAAEYASWLAGFSKQHVVFVNAATGSGDFVPVLKAQNRVVVTATKTSNERNESMFLQYFAGALGMDAADADKDGRLSVFEVFRFARTEVGKVYTSSNRMQTEHALVSDSLLASRVAFGKTAASADPRIAGLIATRQALESEVASLRSKKATMTADAYNAELERLLLALAEKTKAIRAAGGGT
ncbi:hypothetical protein [Gemmatimonas sp.]|uniref:hypothetical protein n=1 Tax=Gemmatimonas sp. TaxID=1962908 RepID=UPI00356A971E